MQLYKAEVPGPVPEKITPRVRQTALLLWGVYVLLSAIQVGALMLGGMDLFESLTHTFGTMATGGFSPLNGSIGQYGNPYFEWVITLFMFLAGANFVLHYLALKGDLGAWWRDEEFRFYARITVASVLAATAVLFATGTYGTLSDSFRYGAFQVVSILTTTGYVTSDYELWPFFIQYLLLFLMFVGGCAGSTGGGIKNMRIIVLMKHVGAELKRLLHPKAIFTVRIGGRVLEREVISSVTAFFVMYIGLFLPCGHGDGRPGSGCNFGRCQCCGDNRQYRSGAGISRSLGELCPYPCGGKVGPLFLHASREARDLYGYDAFPPRDLEEIGRFRRRET